jgi:acetate kinase
MESEIRDCRWGSKEARTSMTASDRWTILAVNVGSSTLKFGIFPWVGGDDPLLRGVLEYSGSAGGELRITDTSETTSSLPIVAARDTAAAAVLGFLKGHELFHSIRAAGHRLVHGGTKLRNPVRISTEVRSLLEEVIPLAPDHLPAELRAIDELSARAPSLIQLACFDTAFHGDVPAVARMFGLPRQLAREGVVRYGFHGLSCEWIVETLRKRGDLAARTLIAHLGNGASITAVLNGSSIDTSMGMTPSGGLVMGTRSGDLDPGVALYLLRSAGFSVSELDDAVNRNGGLLGISESSSDVRELLAASSTDSRAEDAIEVFCYQAAKFIGAYATALGGIDALVFTGGIGERSPEVRERICRRLGFLKIHIDPVLNRANASTISAGHSSAMVRAMKTQEEVMIARQVREFFRNSPI